MREEAQAPAFQAQIEDCQTLIDYFSIRLSGGTAPEPTTSAGAEAVAQLPTGVEQLNIRKVDADVGEGLVVRKKKGQDEDNYFVANKRGKKGGKANGVNGTAAPHAEPPAKADTKLHLPFGTLTALLSLSIPPPTANDEIAQTIENLKKKKAYFVAIQPKTTQENIAKAEAQIKKMERKIDGLTGEGDKADGVPDEIDAEAVASTLR